MSWWMWRGGYRVKEGKGDVVGDYYGGVEGWGGRSWCGWLSEIGGVMLWEEEFSVWGMRMRFKRGRRIWVKGGSGGGIIKMLWD